MKLRNKKTGGLANLIVDKDLLRVKTDAGWADYSSLAELNEEWEDYAPTEPPIKDEKIRKVVRAWAEAIGVSRIMTAHSNFDTITIANLRDPYKQISFSKERVHLPACKVYTIDELCGEGE